MKLNKLSFDTSKGSELKIQHPEIKDVELTVTLRDPLSLDYKRSVGEASRIVYQAFEDKTLANVMLEAVSSIKDWDIDDNKCDMDTMIDLFKKQDYQWIAISVYDHMFAKKFLGMKI